MPETYNTKVHVNDMAHNTECPHNYAFVMLNTITKHMKDDFNLMIKLDYRHMLNPYALQQAKINAACKGWNCIKLQNTRLP